MGDLEQFIAAVRDAAERRDAAKLVEMRATGALKQAECELQDARRRLDREMKGLTASPLAEQVFEAYCVG